MVNTEQHFPADLNTSQKTSRETENYWWPITFFDACMKKGHIQNVEIITEN
jgi:hypothetical protein